MIVGMAVLLLWKGWNALTKACSLRPLPVKIQLYLRFKRALSQYKVLSQHSDGLVLQKQK